MTWQVVEIFASWHGRFILYNTLPNHTPGPIPWMIPALWPGAPLYICTQVSPVSDTLLFLGAQCLKSDPPNLINTVSLLWSCLCLPWFWSDTYCLGDCSLYGLFVIMRAIVRLYDYNLLDNVTAPPSNSAAYCFFSLWPGGCTGYLWSHHSHKKHLYKCKAASHTHWIQRE